MITTTLQKRGEVGVLCPIRNGVDPLSPAGCSPAPQAPLGNALLSHVAPLSPDPKTTSVQTVCSACCSPLCGASPQSTELPRCPQGCRTLGPTFASHAIGPWLQTGQKQPHLFPGKHSKPPSPLLLLPHPETTRWCLDQAFHLMWSWAGFLHKKAQEKETGLVLLLNITAPFCKNQRTYTHIIHTDIFKVVRIGVHRDIENSGFESRGVPCCL